MQNFLRKGNFAEMDDVVDETKDDDLDDVSPDWS